MSETVLVTGGAGFIGSHSCLALLEAGDSVVVVDNLANASEEALRRVEKLSGKSAPLHRVDIRDGAELANVFARHTITSVIHFAGLKAVGESVAEPLKYYDNNVLGTLRLIEQMRVANVRRLVFSSSATVYGAAESNPIREDFPLHATNPYGRSKLIIEDMLRDVSRSEEGWHIAMLRYFNPVGAHESGMMGEDPRGIPNNLMPYMMRVAVGALRSLTVFGADYPTPDGTGVRDYVHVMDLAEGHVAALRYLSEIAGAEAFNLGTGQGHSVLELVRAAAEAVGRTIPYEVAGRRPGDVAACYAEVSRAAARLNWRATRDLRAMCVDAWRWQAQNPNGYGPVRS